jgi:large subunit ribosomal protein L18
MSNPAAKVLARKTRQRRVRRKVQGTAQRPRLSVFRSAKHVYAQIIDDTVNRVLTSASSLSKEFRATGKSGGNVAGAVLVGELVAEKARQQGIHQVVFDRNGFLYHGRVKAVATGARDKGLEF